MKVRTLGLITISVTAMLASVPAGASAGGGVPRNKGGRTVTVPYSASPTGEMGEILLSGPIAATVSIPGGPERFASFKIVDAAGQKVSARVLSDEPSSGGLFCGSTSSPLSVPPGKEVTVELFLGVCHDGTPSVPTTGTVEATFFPTLPLPRQEITGYSPFYWGVGVRIPGGVITSSVMLSPGPGRFLSVKIEDQSGGKVGADIVNGDHEAYICGETEEPFPVQPNFETRIDVYAGTCDDGSESPSTPTRGTITATFSNSPQVGR